jgi:membrane-associated phospholipid phosphatase
MIKQKKFLIPIIIIYVILVSVLVITAVYPALDYSISEFLTSGGSVTYTIGNIFEIYIEPVTLLPMCFVFAAAGVCALRWEHKKVAGRILGALSLICGEVFAQQMLHRIIKYYSRLTDISKPWIYPEEPLFSDKLWVKIACAAVGAVITVVFVLLARKIEQKYLMKALKVMIVCMICLFGELATIEGLKLLFGRMRYRYWISTNDAFWPWYRLNGKPASDGYKSFPSGHTANSFVVMSLTFFFDAFGKKKAGDIARIGALCWVIFAMTTRIMAGAHFLSDVAAGFLVSFTILVVSAAFMFKNGVGREEK